MKEKMKKKEYIRFDRTPFKPLTKEEKEMEKIGVLLLIDSLKVKGKDNMKEILKEIENIEKVADLKTKVLLQMLKAKVIKMIVEEETLIQEERKEAVRGFADWWNEGVLDDFYSIDDNDTEAYLQSLDKGDKITSNTLTITEEELENASYTSSTIESEGKK